MPFPPSDPNPVRPAVISFSSQKQEGSLGSLQLSGSRSPGLRSNSGAFQGTVPNRRRKLTLKLWPCTSGLLRPAWQGLDQPGLWWDTSAFFLFKILS